MHLIQVTRPGIELCLNATQIVKICRSLFIFIDSLIVSFQLVLRLCY